MMDHEVKDAYARLLRTLSAADLLDVIQSALYSHPDVQDRYTAHDQYVLVANTGDEVMVEVRPL